MTPRVSFIIAAHNEARRIRTKIENTLELDYPPGLIEVVVASDHSTDGTDEVVGEYASRGVRLIRSAERRGKEYAQRLAVDEVDGEILVFSDVGDHARRLRGAADRQELQRSDGRLRQQRRPHDERRRPAGRRRRYVKYRDGPAAPGNPGQLAGGIEWIVFRHPTQSLQLLAG